MQKVENVDYELVPVQDVNNEQGWDVRILTGEFTESVIRFGNVAVDGNTEYLTFNFLVVYSPIVDLNPDDNEDLQKEAGDILISIIEQSIQEKSLVIKDKGTPIEQ